MLSKYSVIGWFNTTVSGIAYEYARVGLDFAHNVLKSFGYGFEIAVVVSKKLGVDFGSIGVVRRGCHFESLDIVCKTSIRDFLIYEVSYASVIVA